MDPVTEKEERLREAACVGDEETVCSLLSGGVSVNSQNPVNGWSPLHWAVKRGHRNVVSRLLTAGANPALQTNKGEVAAQLSDSADIRAMLGASPDESPPSSEPPPITPNYLANPPFPYVKPEQLPLSAVNGSAAGHRPAVEPTAPKPSASWGQQLYAPSTDQELVLKVRVANPMQMENDFIEVEMNRSKLTFRDLLATCCRELQVQPEKVLKVRKLPNTMLRKDKDVTRLQDFQEIELVLKTTNKPVNPQYVISPSTDGPASFVY